MMRGFMRALDDMLAGLAPRRILEIGVGEGHVMSRVRERFPGVPLVGLDLPDEALSDEWQEQGLPCMFGDATTLPFPDDSFDLVLAIEVLEHVPEPDAALAELARVCSGTFVASVPFEPIWRAGNVAAPPLRPRPRQHARPRQPLDPLGLPQVRRDPVPRPADPQPPPLDDDPRHLPLTASSSSGSRSPCDQDPDEDDVSARRLVQAGPQRAGDHRRPLGDVLPRVLVDPLAGVLQLVAALRVAGPLGRRAVTLAAGDLDDDRQRLEVEVDPGVRARRRAGRSTCGDRPRQSGLAHELEEAPLEHRVAARVDERAGRAAARPSAPTTAIAVEALLRAPAVTMAPSRTALSIAASSR